MRRIVLVLNIVQWLFVLFEAAVVHFMPTVSNLAVFVWVLMLAVGGSVYDHYAKKRFKELDALLRMSTVNLNILKKMAGDA